MADWYGAAFRRVLFRAERRRDSAIFFGLSCANTLRSKSSALLCFVTRCDHLLIIILYVAPPAPGSFRLRAAVLVPAHRTPARLGFTYVAFCGGSLFCGCHRLLRALNILHQAHRAQPYLPRQARSCTRPYFLQYAPAAQPSGSPTFPCCMPPRAKAERRHENAVFKRGGAADFPECLHALTL